MKKIAIIVLASACFSVVSLAGSEEGAVEPVALCSGEVVAQQSSEGQAELVEPFLLAETPSSSIPECPQTQTCAGGSNVCDGQSACAANGPSKSYDTGSDKCTRNGQVLACIFGTIHVKKQKCGLCPCCFQNPACFCPIDPNLCGNAITLFCQ